MGTYVLAHLNALGGGVVAYLIPFLFVLSLVVFFHELGHFLVARWCGVRVLVFSIGFGPEIVSTQTPPNANNGTNGTFYIDDFTLTCSPSCP